MKKVQRFKGYLKGSLNSALILGLVLVSLLAIPISEAQAKFAEIQGTVKDASGESLIGALVNVKGKSGGSATDVNGNFRINAEPTDVLVISYVGYVTQEIAVGNRVRVDVVLAEDAKSLDEVVVIGYGVANKRDLTGSIVKVGGKEVADKPNPNPIASLQGKVAGLQVVNNGTPGKAPDIRIRGTVSIGSVQPLYVVDGIFNDNIDYLNPNDIESFEILKDPSSLAIFGVRGASGVIMITTKRAKTGAPVVTFNSSFGMKNLDKKIKVANAAQFRELFAEERANIGASGSGIDFDIFNSNTDWIDAVTQKGYFTSNNINVAATTDRNKFSAGVGYITDEGVVLYQKLKKLTINIADEYKIKSYLKVGFNVNAMNLDKPLDYAEGVLDLARKVVPVSPIFNSQEKLYNSLPAIQNSGLVNPLLELDRLNGRFINKEIRAVSSAFAELSFLKNFNFRTTLYADISSLDSRNYRPMYYAYDLETSSKFLYGNQRSMVSQGDETYRKFQADYILSYNNRFGKHSVNSTLGATQNLNTYKGLFGSVNQGEIGQMIPDDPRFWFVDNGFGDAQSKRSSSNQWEKATIGYLFRTLYSFDSKYYVNFSFRRDGSSQISPNNRWKNFWAAGAAWDITSESFMKDQKVFDYLKLKGSYGILGNQNTYDFNYPFYPGLVSGTAAVFGNNIFRAAIPAYLADENLTWEKVAAKEVGLEFAAVNNKLRGEIAWYDKKTSDLMVYFSGAQGASNGLTNEGSIRNSGIELSASYNHSFSDSFSMTVGGNFTTVKNKVLSLDPENAKNGIIRDFSRTIVGSPIGSFFGYVVEGVYQSNREIANSPTVSGFSVAPGDLKFKDINGDGVIDANDRTEIGNPTPDFMYGFNVGFNYKNWDLGVDAAGVYGNEIFRAWGGTESPFQQTNYPEFKMNRWNGAGTSNWEPILALSHRVNYEPSTYMIEDGSYFRLRNVTLGYNFKSTILSKLKLQNVRLYGNVQNLVTFANNSGYTPEFGGTALNFGVDRAGGPNPRVTTFGLNVTF